MWMFFVVKQKTAYEMRISDGSSDVCSSDLADGDIIVTAQRRAESINDVGMAIQAVDAETLENLRVTDVRDLTAVAPSFTVSQSYQGVPTYTLRGIGFNTINLSATSTVGTYVDEVAYAYPIMNTGPIMDLERVEVLRSEEHTSELQSLMRISYAV